MFSSTTFKNKIVFYKADCVHVYNSILVISFLIYFQFTKNNQNNPKISTKYYSAI